MKTYALSGQPPTKEKPWGKIEFETDNRELYEFVLKYMETITDAFRWQNHIERTKREPKTY
jgi:tRNA G46 methylase TrmB